MREAVAFALARLARVALVGACALAVTIGVLSYIKGPRDRGQRPAALARDGAPRAEFATNR